MVGAHIAYGVSLVAAALVLGAPPSADSNVLTAAANSTARPRECVGRSRGAQRAWQPSIWDEVREPQIRRYCDLLGKGQARLAKAPAAARDTALLASQIAPGHAAPLVLQARAAVALEALEDAVTAFEQARKIDPLSVEDPLALHDYANALRRTGKEQQALAVYRVLVPRLGLLPSQQERTLALLEAAALAMKLGPENVRESIALLNEGRSQPSSRYAPDLLALLALALDRAGDSDQAQAVADLFARERLQIGDTGLQPYLSDPADGLAMAALVLERTEPRRSLGLWERYLARGPRSAYADHARKHLEAVKVRAAHPAVAPKAGARPGPKPP
jgi:tetratricopeptide (TPR) repeat protein